MDRKALLLRDFGCAIEDLDSLLAACTEEQSTIRCGPASRTIAATVNHLADWLIALPDLAPQAAGGGAAQPRVESVEEMDARFAKASAHLGLTAARARLHVSTGRFRARAEGLDPDGIPRSVRRWSVEHIRSHAAEIHAALLATRVATKEITP